VLLAGSMAWSLLNHSVLSSFDIGSAYWAVLYSLLLIGFVRLSWHGVSLPTRPSIPARLRRRTNDLPSPPVPAPGGAVATVTSSIALATGPSAVSTSTIINSPSPASTGPTILASVASTASDPRSSLSEGQAMIAPGPPDGI
jgi:hypothetical protein